jgi:ribonuclease HIII
MAMHKELKLPPQEQQRRKVRLLEWAASPELKREQHCLYRLDATLPHTHEKFMVKQYTNGTFTLQTQSDMGLTQALSALGLTSLSMAPKATGVGYYPYGCDESGKGDYFGPLVTACTYVPESALPELKRLGITDSKAMTDALIQRVAPELVSVLGNENVAYLALMPQAYNTHYAEFKAKGQHLNHLLAAMHAKTLAGLLAKQANPSTHEVDVMVDQFSHGTHMQDAIRTHCPQAKVMQATKAELAYPSVAAASVIARYKFLQGITQLSQEHGINLPLGAGAKVLETARGLKRQRGIAALTPLVKLHFKTTEQL